MAQQQQNITISAPGFGGVNTEVSPTQQGEAFASIADNCIIDKYGRIASRKGFVSTLVSDANFTDSDQVIGAVHEHLCEDGTLVFFGAAENKIFKGETTPVDDTPIGATITANDWQMITFNDDCYFLQSGHTAIQYKHATTTTAEIAAIPEGSCGAGVYGRLWVAGVSGTENIVHWSDLQDGIDFTTGTSGTIDVGEYWPTGHDTVQALVGHNGFLIVFGKKNILVYSGAEGDPTGSLVLEDAINGIGCISRDTVVSIGSDIYFLDRTGIRSLARTVQEKSIPIGDISGNVRTDMLTYIDAETDTSAIKAVYSPENSFVLVLFPTSDVIACFSTAELHAETSGLPDPHKRATFWTGMTYECFTNTTAGRLVYGDTSGYGNYSGYIDGAASYRMRYYSNPFSFSDSAMLKFPKQIDLTMITGNSQVLDVYWAFDYDTVYRHKQLTLTTGAADAEYGIAEYNEDEYSGGIKLERTKANVGGSGVVVTVGIEADVSSDAISIQEMNIQATLGRIV